MVSKSPVERLNRYRLISTSSPDVLRDALVDKYGAKIFELRAGPETFRGACNFVALQGSDLSYGMTRGPTKIQFSEQNTVRQTFVLSGAKRTFISKTECVAPKGYATVVPAGATFYSEYSNEFAQLILKIRPELLRSKLSSLIGQTLNKDIEFKGGVDSRTPDHLQLRRIVSFLLSEIERPGVDKDCLAVRELEQTLFVSFLSAHEHNYSRFLKGDVVDVPSFLGLTDFLYQAS